MLNALASSLRSRYRQSLEKRTAALDPQTRADLARDIHRSTVAEVEELQEMNDSIERAQLALEGIQQKKRFVGVRLTAYQNILAQRSDKLKRAQERLATGGATFTEHEDLHSRTSGNFFTERKPLADSQSLRDVNVNDSDEEDEQTDSAVHQDDEETGEAYLTFEELQGQQLQLQNEHAALAKVENSYKAMEADAVALQTKIYVLERKRDEILLKTGQCRDFLVAAAHVEEEQEVQEDDDTDHSVDDLEEGQDDAEAGSTRGNNELIVPLSSESNEEVHSSTEGAREEDAKTK